MPTRTRPLPTPARLLAALVVGALLLTACGSDDDASGNETSPIVLVHGAWQDGSSWAQVQEELESSGRTVSAITLPGRDGADAGLQTIEGYRDAVIAEVEAFDEPVILVGHSFGGMTISAVAEAIPDQVASLAYVAAYLPADGDSLQTLAEQDHLSVLPEEGNLNFSDDFTVATVPPERFAGIFCPDCVDADLDAVAASAVAEPAAPLAQPVSLTGDNFGAVPKTYIMTARDTVVGTQLQASMVTRTPVDEILVLDTGHAPYVSAAVELAGLLDDLS
ncbi:MAG: alpha/beta fold hydrolase [Actinomycetota bacterium]